jgi:hypothetical protein
MQPKGGAPKTQAVAQKTKPTPSRPDPKPEPLAKNKSQSQLKATFDDSFEDEEEDPSEFKRRMEAILKQHDGGQPNEFRGFARDLEKVLNRQHKNKMRLTVGGDSRFSSLE